MPVQSTGSTNTANLASIANTSELYRGPEAGQDESNEPKLLKYKHLRLSLVFSAILICPPITLRIEVELASTRCYTSAPKFREDHASCPNPPIAMHALHSSRFARVAESVTSMVAVLVILLLVCGCGTTTQRVGTEQLLMSEAVDLAVSQIDFQPLRDQRVYLDSSYLQSVKGFGFVNAPYIISSLRQQITAAGCLLQDKREDAEIIVEARVGALGTDGHEVIYGVPKNNLLSSAATVIPNAPTIPTIPEISAARIDALSGIAKVMVFAYDAKTRKPVWQSGVARAESTSRNSWILGAGPFQRGTVHDGTRFAGEKLDPKLETPFDRHSSEDTDPENTNGVAYFEEHNFEDNRTPPSAEPPTRLARKPDDEANDGDER